MPTQTWTTLSLLQTTAKYLDERGVESGRLAAERLLAHVLGCKRVDLYLDTERPLDERELEPYRKLIRSYAAGEPLQYIVAEAEFMGLTLRVDRRALIPRPETEILVDAVVKRLQSSAPGRCSILELGVGSGAVAVALATMLPHAEVWATDVDPQCTHLAQLNVAAHGLESRVHLLTMRHFDALAPELAGVFDCVVSNPPYVRTDELEHLPAVVREHEPIGALHGGADGLDFYRYLSGPGLQFLSASGTLAVEIGSQQAADVEALFGRAGLAQVSVLQDYAGHDRVVLGSRD